ncbi:MAG TPA: amylo-alpha-1,6-glucosidase [Candidatus Limnocylindrales bacterium]|nr:amylo-alpha-1,6-glucosidase [Candidatus Limnocylindrales bacterium]
MGDLTLGATREWLVADGKGGFAMGTASGLRTRRYHALLVVPNPIPARRMVGLVSLDPVLNGTVRIATHEWADGTIAPQGHIFLERFDLVHGLPRWHWRVGETVLERQLAVRHGHSCVAVVHRLLAGPPVELSLEALCAWRDQHGEQHGSIDIDGAIEGAVIANSYRLRGPNWTPDGTWMHGVRHRMEAERGYLATEDLLLAGRFRARLERPGDTLEVTAWAGDLDVEPPPAGTIIDEAMRRNARFDTLGLAADAFIIEGPQGPDVVAGYPWFGAWSRDTMISYEGLFLETGRFDQGRALLKAYAATLNEGMLANTADSGTVGYNTADATLWFVHAIDRHVARTGDTELRHELSPALEQILKAHLEGTRYGIRVDPADGLLWQGAEGEALTWMDARVDGVPVTPRRGKAVEINALWCNALAVLKHELHGKAVASFREAFGGGPWLRDTLDSDAALSNQLRPNQLLAYSLPHSPMDPDPVVLHRIGEALLTPLGLRTLAPGDPDYKPRHAGTLLERDHAYHQGTVWPWLIGPYASAVRKAGGSTAGLFDGLLAHLGEWGLGSVSETCHGDAPHGATGCPFQAWSVAELLRGNRM